MSKKDKIKEKIVSLRFWLGIVVATFLAIIGWCITNYTTIEFWLLSLGFMAVISLGILALLLSKKIESKIEELEDL